jgi:hypothetical protein
MRNSSDIGPTTETESARIADIYENSFLTISAEKMAMADASVTGISYQKTGTRYRVDLIRLHYKNIGGDSLTMFVRRNCISG